MNEIGRDIDRERVGHDQFHGGPQTKAVCEKDQCREGSFDRGKGRFKVHKGPSFGSLHSDRD